MKIVTSYIHLLYKKNPNRLQSKTSLYKKKVRD
jgi:hypothetical protein